MKRLRLILFMFLVLPLSSMAQTVVTYSYDAAGNRATRVSSIEVAIINESPAIENSNVPESDAGHISVDDNHLLCNVPEANPENVHSEYPLEKNYLWNKAQLILCHLESPLIIAKDTNITQKRI